LKGLSLFCFAILYRGAVAMLSYNSRCRVETRGGRAVRRGFTLVELLAAMALITLIMSVLSQAFVEGLDTFRHLKAIGDLQEELRTATIDAIDLRSDILAGREQTQAFIAETLRTGSPDRVAASALQARYESIGADAQELDRRLRDLQQKTTNPAARRMFYRTLNTLGAIKFRVNLMLELLGLINPPPPPPTD
jgi:prepilin-type N-terminal cleavage/methylation domain-containing protein